MLSIINPTTPHAKKIQRHITQKSLRNHKEKIQKLKTPSQYPPNTTRLTKLQITIFTKIFI